MVVLHIAAIKNEPTSGVDVAVPQHIRAQAVSEQAALLNVNNIPIDMVEHQFFYQPDFGLEQLPEPFSKAELVVFHNIYQMEYLKISRALIRNGIPYIIVPHGGLAQKAQRKKGLKKYVANLVFFHRFFEGASAIQFLSEQEMNASKYRDKGFIGTNGVSVPETQRVLKNRKEIKMVYVGRMEIQIKGLDMMVEAVSKSRRLFEEHQIHLDLYGPDSHGQHEKVLELIAKYNVSDCISLHDAVVGKEKENALLDADVFIQTSRTEGMSMGILEALSYGLPCVITEGTGLGEIIRQYNAGWIADTSVAGIADAIKEAVLDRTMWNEKSSQAKKLIADHFVWEKTAGDALEVYKRIVRMRRR